MTLNPKTPKPQLLEISAIEIIYSKLKMSQYFEKTIANVTSNLPRLDSEQIKTCLLNPSKSSFSGRTAAKANNSSTVGPTEQQFVWGNSATEVINTIANSKNEIDFAKVSKSPMNVSKNIEKNYGK